jgi:hypothetical protein|tara:strand:+ start:388 stop:591 length:204 start_codon:yes stop_codon:yes gene_type:complete
MEYKDRRPRRIKIEELEEARGDPKGYLSMVDQSHREQIKKDQYRNLWLGDGWLSREENGTLWFRRAK